MKLLIIGLLFININITVDVNQVVSTYHYLNLVPTFVGCLLVSLGCRSLAKESLWFRSTKTKIVNLVSLILALAENAIMLYIGDDYLWVQLFYVVCSFFYYYQMYIISRGIIDMDEGYALNTNARFLLTLLIIMVVFEASSYIIAYLLPKFGIIAYFFTVGVVFIICLFVGKLYLINKEYKKYLAE